MVADKAITELVHRPAMTFDDQDRIVARLVNVLIPQVRETELRRIRGQRPKALSVYEKILLSRLSVFAGGWTLEAAAQVCADPEE